MLEAPGETNCGNLPSTSAITKADRTAKESSWNGSRRSSTTHSGSRFSRMEGFGSGGGSMKLKADTSG
jgi:hypothetical protein